MGIDLLEDVELTPDATDANGAPVLSSKYRSLFDEADLVLTASYQTRYSYSGTGKFVGFVLHLSGTDVDVKFSVDSEVIFELNIDDVGNVQFGNPANSGPGGFPTGGGPCVDPTGKKFAFYPPYPIVYGTDVKIEVKTDGNNIDILRSIVSLTKET